MSFIYCFKLLLFVFVNFFKSVSNFIGKIILDIFYICFLFNILFYEFLYVYVKWIIVIF